MPELKEILKKKKEEIERQAEARTQALQVWQEKLEHLMETIGRWLSPLTAEGLATVTYSQISINEEVLGNYRTTMATITFIDGQTIFVRPKARYIIGGDGRVDIELGTRTIMLIGQEDDPGWFIAEREGGGQSRKYPFNKESFESVISSIITQIDNDVPLRFRRDAIAGLCIVPRHYRRLGFRLFHLHDPRRNN
jgi:hypothetical protein